MRVVDYVLGHREEPPAPGLLVLRADFGREAPLPAPGPEPPPDGLEQARAIAEEVKRLVAEAQQHRPPWGASLLAYKAAMAQILDHDIGPIADYMDQLLALLPKAPSPPPAPAPPAFALPLPPGAVYGRTKWLPGSTGVDLFTRRGTPVYAPAESVVVSARGGTGLAGGAELVLATPDRAWAWRYRHVQPRVQAGQQVPAGAQVGVVEDASLDRLCPDPVREMPDGWQHLDLSVSRGTDRFPPEGGSGGNYPAPQWLAEIGYQGRELPRTPGPPDCRL